MPRRTLFISDEYGIICGIELGVRRELREAAANGERHRLSNVADIPWRELLRASEVCMP